MTPDQLTLQERVRRFNLGTPTAMHVGTHELVNDLWRELEKHTAAPDMLAALDLAATTIKEMDGGVIGQENGWESEELFQVWLIARAAIAKTTGA